MSEHDPARAAAALTDWLAAEQRPMHAGVYERRAPAGPFSCWDGDRWRADAGSAAQAARASGASRIQRAPWRGLVEPSAAPCATCRGHTVIDRGVDGESDVDLIEECPDC